MTLPSLDELGIRHGTDKASTGHNYLKYYERELKHLRFEPIKILEIGVYHADSLRLWRDYFPNATIVGADITDCSQHDEERIKTVICDQSKQEDLLDLEFKYGPFDLIILDGAHQSAWDILTFNTLFPFLKSGGIFINEDVLCNYTSRFTDNFQHSIINHYKTGADAVNFGGKQNPDYLCANKILERDKVFTSPLTTFEYSIEYITFYCGTVVIKKL